MAEALVSVIIPCYNQSKYLGQALASVFSQTYEKIEVIVVNDGSTDDIEGALALYAHHRSMRVIDQENQGLPNARNRGLSLARGDFIQFLDADDWLHPEKIDRAVGAFEAHPQVGLVYCDYFLVYNDRDLSEQNTVGDRCADPHNPELFQTWWIQGVFPPCAALVRKKWIDIGGGFHADLPAFADYEWWMRLSALGCQAYYLPARLAYYRQHEGSITADPQRLHAALQLARSEFARRFPHKIGEAMDYLDAYYYTRLTRLQEEIEAQRAEITALRNAAAHTSEGGNRTGFS
jgi:glycosyltransferase involved in cell wall biosynthesis